MSRFKDSSGNVIDVPDELDAMHRARGYVEYNPAAPVQVADLVSPAAVAPAGSTGDPVPDFDPAEPLKAGVFVALDHIEDIKGQPLDDTLEALSLDTSGKADDKRDRLAARLNEEATRG